MRFSFIRGTTHNQQIIYCQDTFWELRNMLREHKQPGAKIFLLRVGQYAGMATGEKM